MTLTFHLIGRWITHNYEIHNANPAWFIPVVGNILVPIAGVPLGYVEISWFFFAVGAVFWIVLFTIVFYRIIFHDPLPTRFMPMLFILIAPPAIGYVAYMALNGGVPDNFARVMFYFALFLVLLVATMARTFLAVPFAVSWWAYTFPLDAAAIAAIEYSHAVSGPVLPAIAVVLLAAASIIVTVVAVRTMAALAAGRLFVPE